MGELQNQISMGFTKESFPPGVHVCLIFDNEEQRQKIVAEYVAAGLRQGEYVRYLTDMTSPENIHSWLSEMEVELPETHAAEAFAIFKAQSAYCPDGQFDPRKLIDGMSSRNNQLKEAGYSGVRSCGEMSWALKGIPGSDRLMEYEALLNTVVETFPHSGMCQYDARLFDGATLLNILKVHPYMIAQGQIVRNPFYIRPDEFLTEPSSDK
jgi:hypothetical protein